MPTWLKIILTPIAFPAIMLGVICMGVAIVLVSFIGFLVEIGVDLYTITWGEPGKRGLLCRRG